MEDAYTDLRQKAKDLLLMILRRVREDTAIMKLSNEVQMRGLAVKINITIQQPDGDESLKISEVPSHLRAEWQLSPSDIEFLQGVGIEDPEDWFRSIEPREGTL